MNIRPERLVAAVCGLCLATLALAAAPRDPYEHLFEQTLGDFSEEIDNARDAGKKGVLLFFEMDECPFCHRMKQMVLNQPRVQDYYRKHFHCFSVDVEGDLDIVDFQGNPTTEKDFAIKQQRVRATPVFAFFDLRGERVARYTGAASSVDEFLWLGQYAAEQVYRRMRFTKFKRLKRSGRIP